MWTALPDPSQWRTQTHAFIRFDPCFSHPLLSVLKASFASALTFCLAFPAFLAFLARLARPAFPAFPALPASPAFLTQIYADNRLLTSLRIDGHNRHQASFVAMRAVCRRYLDFPIMPEMQEKVQATLSGSYRAAPRAQQPATV